MNVVLDGCKKLIQNELCFRVMSSKVISQPAFDEMVQENIDALGLEVQKHFIDVYYVLALAPRGIGSRY